MSCLKLDEVGQADQPDNSICPEPSTLPDTMLNFELQQMLTSCSVRPFSALAMCIWKVRWPQMPSDPSRTDSEDGLEMFRIVATARSKLPLPTTAAELEPDGDRVLLSV
jgi:hypothetical protein